MAGRRIEREILRRELPEALARYESGETLHVGTLRLKRGGNFQWETVNEVERVRVVFKGEESGDVSGKDWGEETIEIFAV